MLKPLAAALLFTTLAVHAGDWVVVPTLPTTQWQVTAGPTDKVTLSTQGQTLVLDYDVDVRDWHQVGHQSLKQASIKLLLAAPVPLAADASRIVFEAWGHMQGTWNTQQGVTQLRPLLQDASGEWLSYTAYPYPHLKSGATTWGRWMSQSFYAGEAGGPTQDVFEASGGDGNGWPTAPLRFAGFEIVMRKAEFGRSQGRLALGEIAVAGPRLPATTPYAYADGLLPKPGTYTLATSVTTGYQQVPRREEVRTLTLLPDDLDSARQQITFPLGPDGEYWLSYQVTDAAGKLVIQQSMRTRVLGQPAAAPLPAGDPATPPALGCLRVNWATHVGGVYRVGEPLSVAVRVFPLTPAPAAPLTLAWKLLPARYDNVLEEGTVAVPAGAARFQDLTVTPHDQPGRDAYRLQLTLQAGEQTLGQTTYELGRTTDFSAPRTTRTGKLLDRDYVKGGAYFRLTYITTSTTKFPSEDAAVADFAKQADEMTKVTRYLTYMIDLRDVEVLPGVYDFALLDRIFDAATDCGATLTIRLGHVDAAGEYTWQPYYRQYNYDGTPIFMHYYGGFSVVDKPHTDLWQRAYRALYDRYRLHPGFQGYYLMQPAGESTIADKPWEGIVSGYEPPMAPAFARWLRDTRHYTLEQVNQRWGTTLKSWEEVALPLPDLTRGVLPDLRLQWVDFCCFKAWVDSDGWYPIAARAIRTYDPNHVVIVYGSPTVARGDADYGHNGGNHFLINEGRYLSAWETDHTGWITEPHHPHRWAAYGDTGDGGWVLDWSLFVMTAQAGGGGANLHIYYDPRPGRMVAHFGNEFAFDRLEKYRPICDELQTMKLAASPVRVAAWQDPYTLYCKHRTVFWPRAEDLKRWFELLKLDSVRYEDLQPAHLDQYRLLLPNVIDEVISDERLQQIDQAVRVHGAKLIIAANTGRYCPERPGVTYALLRQLGLPPPTGPYVQDQAQVSAKVTAANPLFAADAQINFFCLADLRKDLQSKEIRDKFWSYPYRWIPQTDYFGYYPKQQPGGDVWAQFADGGAAVTHHQVGKGEVVVFWGVPDYRPALLPGLMTRAAAWAGISEPGQGAPIANMLEGASAELKRRYVLLYQEQPGTYAQPFPATPDGNWFVEDLVADQKLGTWTGAELRGAQLPTTYIAGCSPLKILRLTPAEQLKGARWLPKYRTVPVAAKP